MSSITDPPNLMNRRRFLGLSAAAFSAACIGAAPSRAALRLSTSSIHFSRLPIEKACQRIAALGFEAIDLWSAYAGCPHLDDALTRLGPSGLRDLLSRNRLKLFAFSVYAGGFPRYAALLGKAGGGIAIRGSAAPAAPGDLPRAMRAFMESLKPELELCEKHDACLAIENHGQSLLDSPDSFKAFVETNRHPRLGIALAPYHLQARRASVQDAITLCGKQLLFFYAWQHAEGVNQLPGHGPTDFTPWLAALDRAGYAGYVNPFMHNESAPDAMSTALIAARDYLRACHRSIHPSA